MKSMLKKIITVNGNAIIQSRSKNVYMTLQGIECKSVDKQIYSHVRSSVFLPVIEAHAFEDVSVE